MARGGKGYYKNQPFKVNQTQNRKGRTVTEQKGRTKKEKKININIKRTELSNV